MKFRNTTLLFGAAIFYAFSGNAQSGPIHTSQVNSTYYVGAVSGFYATIQSAVTKACGLGAGTVSIPSGATPSDSIGVVTGGCTAVAIIDERPVPLQAYKWNGSAYAVASSSGGVSNGTSGQVAQYPANGTTVQGATLSGDATMAVGGVVTVTKTNGTPFAPSATVDTTNAANIGSGTLLVARGGTGVASVTGLLAGRGTAPITTATVPDIVTSLGYTPATGPNFTTDFIACYLFVETPTSGGSLPDHCGNNNGTIGTTVPVATGTYWQFTNFVTSPVILPAALNGAKTFYFAIQVPPAVAGSFNASQINTLLGGTVAGNLDINASSVASGAGFQTFGGFSAFAAGATSASMANVFNGVAILTLVCGTPDVLYFNGQPVPNLAAPSTTSCGKTTSGSYEIGDSADSGNFSAFAGFYDLRVSNNQHTPAQVAQNVAALYNELVGRGVSLAPNRYTYPSQQLFFAGDSITCGYNTGGSPACSQGTPWIPGTASSNAYTNHLVLDQTFGIQNFGVTSAQVQQQVAAAPVLYAPLCNTQSGNTIAVLFEGTNNNGANTAAETWAYAAGWSQIMRSYGCKTVYISMLSRGGTASGTTYESFKTQLDAQARANWKQAGFDAFIDMEADPFLGCVNCYANTTYFTGDQIHPTAIGQLKLALAVQATINYLSAGSTVANPNPLVITAATYASIYEDGGLIFDTAANNIVDTLTSAQWMTGRIISRCNTSTSGANTLTITAPADYPFNDVTGMTTVTVANNTCQKFQATYIAGTPNGDYWRLVQ